MNKTLVAAVAACVLFAGAASAGCINAVSASTRDYNAFLIGLTSSGKLAPLGRFGGPGVTGACFDMKEFKWGKKTFDPVNAVPYPEDAALAPTARKWVEENRDEFVRLFSGPKYKVSFKIDAADDAAGALFDSIEWDKVTAYRYTLNDGKYQSVLVFPAGDRKFVATFFDVNLERPAHITII